MKNLFYVHGLGCCGDSISMFNAEEPDFFKALDIAGINVLWHPSLSNIQDNALKELVSDIIRGEREVFIFAVEGAVPLGFDGEGSAYEFCGYNFVDLVRKIASVSRYVVAIGTCAAFGGIPASKGNPTSSTGLQYRGDVFGGALGKDFVSKGGLPVVNVPGCPAHPDWIVETFVMLAGEKLKAEDLDYANRPLLFYNSLAHHGCPRNEFYEFKSSAEQFGQMGCLFEFLGCRGTQCESDCNVRLWLGRTGSCPRGGFPCISCTSQVFPTFGTRFFKTEMVGNIPRFLPRDVPKAWYIGISSLAKMATPERLKVNSVSPYPVYPLRKVKR